MGSFDAITKNRAEELGYDMWNHFVVPPYFDRLGIFESRKSNVFIGGRGCGKTMLIRYLSHVSMFSSTREVITDSDVQNIGLYWRMDTHFASMMDNRALELDVWKSAFTHFATLQITLEVLKSIKSISNSKYEGITPISLENLTFKELQDYDPTLPSGYDDLVLDLKSKIRKFHAWLNNVRTSNSFHFLPKELISTCVENIQYQIPKLKSSIFFIYLDEYENLLEYQQRMVNTWLKHSEMPVIFNLAMKRNSFTNRKSLGIEQLSADHDFRVHDLEKFFDYDLKFNLFAAEILFLRLKQSGVTDLPINEEQLRDLATVKDRLNENYVRRIISRAREIYPGYTKKELSKQIFNDDSLFGRIKNLIFDSLKSFKTTIQVDEFIVHEDPRISIVIPSLLRRSKITPAVILGEIQKFREKSRNDFLDGKEWVKNMFYGSLIKFYSPLNRICPIYCGFDTYILMSKGNLRHFLELCNKSLRLNESSSLVISQETQNIAAKQAATSLLGEIKTFGKFGNTLYTFVIRLGYLMYLSHQRPNQSEPEMTHFGITSGKTHLTERSKEIIKEAVKWSVLFEVQSTKVKDGVENENFDYVLNPIYSSYFSISYRKGRKLMLSTDQVHIILEGEITNYDALRNKLDKEWGIENESHDNPTYSQLKFDI